MIVVMMRGMNKQWQSGGEMEGQERKVRRRKGRGGSRHTAFLLSVSKSGSGMKNETQYQT